MAGLALTPQSKARGRWKPWKPWKGTRKEDIKVGPILRGVPSPPHVLSFPFPDAQGQARTHQLRARRVSHPLHLMPSISTILSIQSHARPWKLFLLSNMNVSTHKTLFVNFPDPQSSSGCRIAAFLLCRHGLRQSPSIDFFPGYTPQLSVKRQMGKANLGGSAAWCNFFHSRASRPPVS